MADGRIRVTVLEGSFAGFKGVGIPLPVCIHLQDLGLHAVWRCSVWTAKQSKTVLRLVLTDLVRSTEGVGRRPDACLDGPLAVWEE